MSRYTEVRDAIGKVLKRADPLCPKLHNHWRFPSTDPKQAYAEFGTVDAEGKGFIHALVWHRRNSPQDSNAKEVFSGVKQVRQKFEIWDIELWYTLIDEANADRVPTEHEAQELCDAIEDQFFCDPDFIALQKKWKIRVDNCGLVEFSAVLFSQSFHCHYGNVTLTLQYPNYGKN